MTTFQITRNYLDNYFAGNRKYIANTEDRLYSFLFNEWSLLKTEPFYEGYYNACGDIADKWTKFKNKWIDLSKKLGYYDRFDIIGSMNETCEYAGKNIKEVFDIDNYDETLWKNYKNSYYPDYDNYCLMERYEIWQDFMESYLCDENSEYSIDSESEYEP